MKYEGVARSWADQAVCSDTGRSHFLLHQSVVFQSDDPKKKKKRVHGGCVFLPAGSAKLTPKPRSPDTFSF